MKALSRRLHTLKSQHDYEEGRHDPGRHASEILALDGEKFRVAKTINEVEVESERLAGELTTLAKTLQTLERDGLETGRGGRADEEETMLVHKRSDKQYEKWLTLCRLKLQVYRSLGITITQDPSDGSFERAVIHSQAKTDVCVVDLDGGIGSSQRTNACWDSI